MKSFLATALALGPEFRARPLKQPIHIAFSYDEEVGCTGVGRMIDDIAKNLPAPEMVIVGEPTDMRIINGHKGRSEEHTSELQSLMRRSYAVFCLKKTTLMYWTSRTLRNWMSVPFRSERATV